MSSLPDRAHDSEAFCLSTKVHITKYSWLWLRRTLVERVFGTVWKAEEGRRERKPSEKEQGEQAQRSQRSCTPCGPWFPATESTIVPTHTLKALPGSHPRFHGPILPLYRKSAALGHSHVGWIKFVYTIRQGSTQGRGSHREPHHKGIIPRDRSSHGCGSCLLTPQPTRMHRRGTAGSPAFLLPPFFFRSGSPVHGLVFPHSGSSLCSVNPLRSSRPTQRCVPLMP